MAESNNIDKSSRLCSDDELERMASMTPEEKEAFREELIRRANKDVEDFASTLEPGEYAQGWPQDRWREEMQKHPLFVTEDVKEGEELPPLIEAMQQLKYSNDFNTPEELAETYKEEGNEHFKRSKYRWAVTSYTAGIEAGSEDKTMNAILHSNRSFAHFKIGNYKKGLRDAIEATGLDPTYKKSYYRGAICAFHLNNFNYCLSLCEKGLQLDPENKPLLELQEKAEKSLVASHNEHCAAVAKEKKEQQEKHDLYLQILSRGVTLADNVLDIHDVVANFPHDDKVHLEDNHLIWPVFFNYPEYETSDFIQKFHEESCFQDQLREMFQSGFAEWDTNKEYRADNLQVYFIDGGSLVKVQSTCSLRKVLADKRYKVENGVPGFFVTVKNSKFDKHFRTKHEFS